MRAEIISIGTELLVGSILNTNARFLSQQLAENAVDVYHQATVGDNVNRVVSVMEQAAARSDLIITSGGLGPTADDITLQALSLFIQSPLKLHAPTHRHVIKRMKSRQYPMTRLVKKQCYLPLNCRALQNHFGTAPGVLAKRRMDGRSCWILVLPGPPRELEPMFLDQALPLLRKVSGVGNSHFLVRSVKIAGAVEAQVAQKVPKLLTMKPPLTVGIYAKPDEVELKIMAKYPSQKTALRKADMIERKIRNIFKEKVIGTGLDTLASVIGDSLRASKETLAIAESCTGGLACNRMAQVPGCSDYFLGGVVIYHNRAKEISLGIQPHLLAHGGAVSETVALAMAKGVREKLGADHGIGITGIAGPTGGSASKPVGTVCIAWASKHSQRVARFRFYGTRTEIQSRAANQALDQFRLFLLSRQRTFK